MFPRTQSVTLVLTLAASAVVTVTTAEAQQRGRIYPAQRAERFDDWTVQAFRDLDADGNGRIAAAEWTYDCEDFRRADHNRDGVLTQREFLGEAANDPDLGAAEDDDASATDDARFLDSRRQPRRPGVAQRVAHRPGQLRTAG